MKLKIDYDFANWNKIIDYSRTNYHKANNLKKKEMDVIRYYTIGKKPIENYPVEIKATWHFENKKRDLDNCSLKNILDSLVKIGILKNDNLNCIRRITYESVIDGKYYVELDIEEYKEEKYEDD